ncbi:hypothetical protein L6452_27959 [Arctium lappa]|uniref:Uncharacterized protein n=1 Tax=Arctium lappa TaxID=4217 RepID=A0ACB8ZX48_ARCLA|nr:hypothetical protein L6452_27959 [Arctium lappa]
MRPQAGEKIKEKNTKSTCDGQLYLIHSSALTRAVLLPQTSPSLAIFYTPTSVLSLIFNGVYVSPDLPFLRSNSS